MTCILEVLAKDSCELLLFYSTIFMCIEGENFFLIRPMKNESYSICTLVHKVTRVCYMYFPDI